MKRIASNFFINASRYLLAIVFIFSGFVKGIDPLGSTYKFIDYFSAFHIGFLEPFALPLAFALCAAELLIGLLLLFKTQVRIAIWGVFLFMLVFTPLTLVVALTDPVSDCGCFGDALKLSNWETFYKNLFFITAATFLFLKRKDVKPDLPAKYEWGLAIVLAMVSLIPPFHGYRNLPLFDFRPYSIGINIHDAMSIPANAPADVYRTTLFYKKDGVVKEFSEENFPWQDTTWKFTDSKSVLVKKGYTPPITDFSLYTTSGWNVTDSVLDYSGYFLLAISHRLDKTNVKAVDKLNRLYYKAKDQNIGFVFITASPVTDIDEFVNQTDASFPFLQADEIMLKTTIRSNPGLILLKSGTIIGKWHHNNFPEPGFFEGNIDAKLIKMQQKKLQNVWIGFLTFVVFSAYFAIFTQRRKRRRGKK